MCTCRERCGSLAGFAWCEAPPGPPGLVGREGSHGFSRRLLQAAGGLKQWPQVPKPLLPPRAPPKRLNPCSGQSFPSQPALGSRSSTRGWAWCFLDGTLSQGAVTGLGNKQFLHETREGACPQLTLTWCSCPTSPPWFPVSHFCWLAESRKCIQTAACRKSICYVTFHLTCTGLTGKSAGGHFITDTFSASLPHGLEDVPMQ